MNYKNALKKFIEANPTVTSYIELIDRIELFNIEVHLDNNTHLFVRLNSKPKTSYRGIILFDDYDDDDINHNQPDSDTLIGFTSFGEIIQSIMDDYSEDYCNAVYIFDELEKRFVARICFTIF